MIINTNVTAMNTHRQMGINQDQQQSAMEKLSSGLRINKAGDDAAGLAISEKMRGQINGLDQASRNAQDGISMIQTAEGALDESHSILQRMRELSVQSANDTNVDADREELQNEVDQLASELNRISDNTEFNTQNLLDGSMEGTFQIGANEGQNLDISIGDMSAGGLGVEQDPKAEFDVDSGSFAAADTAVDPESNYSVVELDGSTVENSGSSSASVDANFGLQNEDGDLVAVSNDGTSYSGLESSSDLGSAELADDSGSTIDFAFGEAVTSGEVTTSAKSGTDISATGTASADFEDGVEPLSAGTYTVNGSNELLNENDEVVATGNTDNDTWSIDGEQAFTTSQLAEGDEINVEAGGIDISDQEAADSAISSIDSAIESVSSQRSEMGAVQNRLEHTISNLDNSSENLSAAESRIRDADMAAQMMEQTQASVKSQAAQSMLAQANQQPQSVLQLLG